MIGGRCTAFRKPFRAPQCALRRIVAVVLLAAAPAVAGTSAQDQVTRDFQKSLTLASGQSVRIDHKLGGVQIHGESGRELKVSAVIHAQAASRAEAEAFADKIRIEVEQSAQEVSIRTVYPERENSFFHFGKSTSFSVDYDISMPSDAPLFVKNRFGGVGISGVHARSEVDVSNGQLTLRDSGAARLTDAFGGIEVRGASDNVSITNNNGSVTVTDMKGSLEIRNRFGNTNASNIQGGVTIAGGNGPVEILNAGNPVAINNSFGPVVARNIRGTLAINNTNGNIDISDVTGTAALNGSFGAIDLKTRVGALLGFFRKLPLYEHRKGARFGARLSPGRKHRPKFGRRQ